MTDIQTHRTGVQLTTKVFPLAFLLLMYKTNVSIDGTSKIVPWGTHFFELPPGRHSGKVGFRYMLGKNMGENGVEINVAAGQTVNVAYRSPLVVFSPGSIEITE